jgi:hypothetical protein
MTRISSPPRWRLLGFALTAMLAVTAHTSCRRTIETPPAPANQVVLQLDAMPLLLRADTSAVQTSQIWATVLQGGEPVADSTVVSFASSLGTITSEALTKDGLARVTFSAPGTTGVAAVIGQVKAVRDTVEITIY